MFPIGLFLLAFFAVSSFANDSNNPEYFLPRTSYPTHYDVRLRFFSEDAEMYSGNMNISIVVTNRSDSLVLHANEVKVSYKDCKLYSENDVIRIVNGTWNSENHFLSLKLLRPIEPGNYKLNLFFKSRFYERMKGLFLSKYKMPNGDQKIMIASHLEPHTARNVFPCYDEPNLKATFKLTIYTPREFNAISNAEINNISVYGNIKKTSFHKTNIRMSTYLLALAVSDFETLKWDYRGKPLRMYAKSDEVQYTEYALNITKQSLQNLEQLLNVEYPSPKLDGVSVPDFPGGMENFGLIVYGDHVIVKNPAGNNDFRLNLICHEIAHQWFGNLVTMKWWDFTWLNEGFASYYAQRISDMIKPEGRFMDNYIVGSVLRLRYDDSLNYTWDYLDRPVKMPNELGVKFGSTSYDKGCVVVRFMSLTFPHFDEAITNYLKEHSFKNTVPNDLYAAFDRLETLPTNVTVKKIVNSWASNIGLPLITLNITRQNGARFIDINQERYTRDRQQKPEKWWIPISLATQEKPHFDDTRPLTWLSDNEERKRIKIEDADGWIVANLQQAVHCRVNYDIENWLKIIEYLRGPDYENIHYLNRMQLLDDSNYLAESGDLPDGITLGLLFYLKQEKDQVVREAARSTFIRYAELLKNTPEYPKYRSFVEEILGKTEADKLLKRFDPKKLIDEALTDTLKRYKYPEAVHKLTERLYSDVELTEIENILLERTRFRSGVDFDYLPFWEDVKMRTASNMAAKQKFFTHNYPGVKDWLNVKFLK